jgi:hypothetical protein
MRMTARLLILVFLFASTFGYAADKKKAGASPSASPDDRVAFHGTIITFAKVAGTFTLKGKKEPAVYVVSEKTKMMKGTAEATLDDLATGVYVRGSARRAADGQFVALTVKIEPKTTAPTIVEKAARAPSPAPE